MSKTKDKQRSKKTFSFSEMPIVSIRKDKKIARFEAGKMLQDKEFIVSALLECFENGDADGVIEILNAHFSATNKSRFSEKTLISRRTLHDVLHGSKNPTLRVLLRCIQECLVD